MIKALIWARKMKMPKISCMTPMPTTQPRWEFSICSWGDDGACMYTTWGCEVMRCWTCCPWTTGDVIITGCGAFIMVLVQIWNKQYAVEEIYLSVDSLSHLFLKVPFSAHVTWKFHCSSSKPQFKGWMMCKSAVIDVPFINKYIINEQPKQQSNFNPYWEIYL